MKKKIHYYYVVYSDGIICTPCGLVKKGLIWTNDTDIVNM